MRHAGIEPARPRNRLAGRVRSIIPHVRSSRSKEPLPCQSASSPPPCFSTLAASAAAQDAKPADPAAAPVDHPARSQADDGGAEDQEPAPGANGMNRNAPNAANYDESKANPYPNLPDPLSLKNGEKVTSARAVVEQEAAGDRRGLRPGGLRPGPQGRAQGDVGSDRDDRGEGRRRARSSPRGCWATSTTRGVRRSRSTSSSR